MVGCAWTVWPADAVPHEPGEPHMSDATATHPKGLDAAVLKVAGVVVLGAIMSILDITVVSVALPTFQAEFDATYAQVAWTMTGYTLALATVIPLSGWRPTGSAPSGSTCWLWSCSRSAPRSAPPPTRSDNWSVSGYCRVSAAACSCRSE